MTKTEMARRITAALFNMHHLPAVDHFEVKRIARRPKNALVDLMPTADEILARNAERGSFSLTHEANSSTRRLSAIWSTQASNDPLCKFCGKEIGETDGS